MEAPFILAEFRDRHRRSLLFVGHAACGTPSSASAFSHHHAEENLYDSARQDSSQANVPTTIVSRFGGIKKWIKFKSLNQI
jgi:hypothetical protein